MIVDRHFLTTATVTKKMEERVAAWIKIGAARMHIVNPKNFNIVAGDICTDLNSLIFSYLPPTIRRKVRREWYREAVHDMVRRATKDKGFACLSVHSDATPLLHKVIKRSGGLLPKMLVEVLKDDFPDKGNDPSCRDDDSSARRDGDPLENVYMRSTNGFGNDLSIYVYLLTRLLPEIISYVPVGLEKYPDMHSILYSWPVDSYDSSAAIRLATIIRAPVSFPPRKLDEAIYNYPDMAAYECRADNIRNLREELDYGTLRIEAIIGRYDVDRVTLSSLEDELRTIRGLRRAMKLLFLVDY